MAGRLWRQSAPFAGEARDVMIVDCHTHWGSSGKTGTGAILPAGLRCWTDTAWTGHSLLGHYNLHRCDKAREDNDRLAHITARGPDRFIPFGTVWPQMGRDAVAEVRRCIEDLGLKGLKFHPWLQGFSTGDPVFGEICGLAGELGVPVFSTTVPRVTAFRSRSGAWRAGFPAPGWCWGIRGCCGTGAARWRR